MALQWKYIQARRKTSIKTKIQYGIFQEQWEGSTNLVEEGGMGGQGNMGQGLREGNERETHKPWEVL